MNPEAITNIQTITSNLGRKCATSAEVCGGRSHLDEANHGPQKSVQKPLKSSLGPSGANKCRVLKPHRQRPEALPHKLTSAAGGEEAGRWGRFRSPHRGFSGPSASKRSD